MEKDQELFFSSMSLSMLTEKGSAGSYDYVFAASSSKSSSRGKSSSKHTTISTSTKSSSSRSKRTSSKSSKTPSRQQRRFGGRRSGVFGDPHLSTFDRLEFDCKAEGEFVLVTSVEDSRFVIQERFTAVPSTGVCSQGSKVSTGIVVKDSSKPTVQISTPRNGTNSSTNALNTVGDCPIDLYVDGLAQTFSTSIGADVNVTTLGSDIQVLHTDTMVSINISVRKSSSFGCHFTVQVFLPYEYREDETVVGLLGTPNGNSSDDWVTRNGTILPAPSKYDSLFEPSYNYCMTNWCIRDADESLFTYGVDESFINVCEKVYEPNDIDLALASGPPEELVNICGSNLVCLVDGLCGSLVDASTALEDEVTVYSNQEKSGSQSPTVSRSPSLSPSFSMEPSRQTSIDPSSEPSSNPSQSPSVKPSSSVFPSMGPTIPCGGSCDDGNLCTRNYCDIPTQKCQTEALVCGEDEACDVFSGDCQDIQNVIPCIAVIDEWDRNDYSTQWSDFRKQYPQRPFCLLVPRSNRFGDSPLPAGFDNDDVNSPDGIDRTTVALVSRDDGNPSITSDWFKECGLDRFGPESIDFIGLFIDTSGSMRFNTVRESAKRFVSEMDCADISVDLVYNGSERWLTPFFTSLKPPEGSSECGAFDDLCPGGECQNKGPNGVCTERKLDCIEPSSKPSNYPSSSAMPSFEPSKSPSFLPSQSVFPSSSSQPSPVPSSPPSLSSQPSSQPTGVPSGHPSSSVRPSKSSSPSEILPSLSPSFNPSQAPSISISPTNVSSNAPSQSAEPSNVPSAVPSKSSEPSSSPSALPSTSPSILPSTSLKPTRIPPALVLRLTTGAITAGDSIGVLAAIEESDINPIILSPPSVSFTLSFKEAEANGTVPMLSTSPSVAVNTFRDTRGVYSITATTIQDDRSFSVIKDFVVLPPASESDMDRLYGELSTAVNGVSETIPKLERAVGSNNTSAIQEALDDLRAYRDSIDLDELSTTSAFAPEGGFLPTLSQLNAAGYSATADDNSLGPLLRDLTANFINVAAALEVGEDLTYAETLNQDALTLIDTLEMLNPSVHGYVAAQSHINYLFAVGIPRVIRAQVNAIERDLLEENVGLTRQRKLFGFGSTFGIVGVRGLILDKVYTPLLGQVVKMAALLAAADLLKSALGLSNGVQPITGGSLSYHVFQRTSYLEVEGANKDYPSRTYITLFGVSAIDAAINAIQSAIDVTNTNVKNPSEFRNALKGLKEAAKGIDEAAKTAQHSADGFGYCFLLGAGCTSLKITQGFNDVNTCTRFLCLPQPVIILAANLESGGAAVGIFNFIKT